MAELALGGISLGLQVVKELVAYYSAFRDRDEDISRMVTLLAEVEQNLNSIDILLSQTKVEQTVLSDIKKNTDMALEGIKQLQKKLDKVKQVDRHEIDTWQQKSGAWAREQGRKFLYPFKKSTIFKISEIVGEIQFQLAIALDVLGISKIIDVEDSINLVSRQVNAVSGQVVGVSEQVSSVDGKMSGISRKLTGMDDTISATFDCIKDSQQRVDDQTVIEWVSKMRFKTKQTEVLSRRQEGTCNWVLESPEFCQWLDGDNPELWCYGIPGAGKTVLTSAIIDHFQETVIGETVGLAFAYCDYQNRETNETLMASLLGQLLEQTKPVDDEVKKVYERSSSTRSAPNMKDISTLLDTVAKAFAKVFIIIDALDECKEEDREGLISSIRKLPSKNIFFLSTSRKMPDLENSFKAALHLTVDAADKDIRAYIDGKIKSTPKLGRILQNNTGLEEEMLKRVIPMSKGMFLMANMYMEFLLQKTHAVNKFKKALKDLPSTLEGAYQLSLDRIRSKGEEVFKTAINVFLWVAIASPFFPLTVEEVQHAIAAQEMDFSEDKIGPDDLITKDFLLEACAGLVDTEQDSGGRSIFRLVHYTALPFLEGQRTVLFGDANTEITETCLRYLLLDDFKTGPCSITDEVRKRVELYPFYIFASREWGIFASRGSETSCKDGIINFLKNDEAMKSAAQILSDEDIAWESEMRYDDSIDFGEAWGIASQDLPSFHLRPFVSKDFPPGIHGLGLASWFGLLTIAQALIDDGADIDETDRFDQTALIIAIAGNHTAVAELLLSRNASLGIVDRDGMSPLMHLARIAPGEKLVKRILQAEGLDLDLKDNHKRSALSHAAEKNSVEVAKALLLRGVEVDSKSDDGETPLLFAVMEHKSLPMLELLLEYGANPDIGDENQRTAISYAASAFDYGVSLRLLAPYSKNLNLGDKQGLTPLMHASISTEGTFMVFTELEAIDWDAKDTVGQTALIHAMRKKGPSRDQIVTFLSKCSTSIDHRDNLGRTALSYLASTNEPADTMKLLIELAAPDAASRDNSGRSIISYAAGNGSVDCLKLLLPLDGVTFETTDEQGQSPLSNAAFNGRTKCVEFILQHSSLGINAQNSEGQTPLSWAASTRNPDLVKVLLSTKELHANLCDRLGRSPLVRAVMAGSLEVAEEILGSGKVNPNLRDNFGRTALHEASYRDKDTMVKLLLGYIDVPDLRDINGHTPLSFAAGQGKFEVVKLLLEQEGINPASKDNVGRTIISWVAHDKSFLSTTLGTDPANGLAIAEFLIGKYDVPFDTPDNKGRTPISWAAAGDQIGVLELLIRKAAALDSKDVEQRTPLSYAAQTGNTAAMRLLLATGKVEKSSRSITGLSPMAYAADCEQAEAVKLLISYGASPQIGPGPLALSYAASSGSIDTVKVLLTHPNVAPDAADENGRTPLSFAAENGWLEIAKLLLEDERVFADSKDMFSNTPLIFASMKGHKKVTELLLSHSSEINHENSFHHTALSVSIRNGKTSIAKLLLDNSNTELDRRNAIGRTPLDFAATFGHYDIVELLLPNVDINSRDDDNGTPLLSAAGKGHNLIVKRLLEHQAKFEYETTTGRTPLSFAASGGHLLTVQTLVAAGANVNYMDKFGCTALSVSARGGHFHVVEFLLSQNADPELPATRSGKTALFLAVEYGHASCVEILINKGALFDYEIDMGGSLLEIACATGKLPVVKVLIKHGLSPDHENNFGLTPLYFSVSRCHFAVAEFLLAHSKAGLRYINRNRGSFLSHCAEGGRKEGIAWMAGRGIDLEGRDINGRTALSRAVGGHPDRCLETVKFLLSKPEVDPMSRDNNGLTPEDWVYKDSSTGYIKELWEKDETNTRAELVKLLREAIELRSKRDGVKETVQDVLTEEQSAQET